MAYLFIVENTIAKPNVETLLISPFKEIWERDTSKDKSQAIKEFCYIEFMTSKLKTNPYAGFDDQVRQQVLQKLYFTDDWKADDLIEQGLSYIVTFQREASPTYSYYLSVLSASKKMKDFFDELDMTEKNERTGLPVWKPKDITSAMIDTDKMLQNINSMKEKVEQELFEQTKTRGNKTINPFEE